MAAISGERRRGEARQLEALFREVTGWTPRIWGSGLIGYGQYHYRYASGREGDSLATGFAPLASKFALHIMPGYNEFGEISARLGKFKRGKSCWYINRLGDVDLDTLRDLIRAGLSDLRKFWPVTPT